MNEFVILMEQLTRSGTVIGASIEEMLDALSLPEPEGRQVVFSHLSRLYQILHPLGLTISHNPISHSFYLETQDTIRESDRDSFLPDRLAATLLVVITLTYQEGDWISVDRATKFRKKSRRSVLADLRELEDLGYIELDRKGGRVRPGPKIAFEIDYDRFFRELTENDD